MRIIAGELGGRVILAPKGVNTRPTMDRVREAIFGMLQFSIYNKTVLDVFSGSGAMAIESVSRGAAHAVLIEKDRASAAVIRENLKSLKIEEKATLYEQSYEDALLHLARTNKRFDIIFLDPPYGKGLVESAMQNLMDKNLLNEDFLIIAEHPHTKPPQPNEAFALKTRRKYGDVGVSVYQMNKPEEEQ